MAFCKKCGIRIEDNAAFCPVCGAAQRDGQNSASNDQGGFGWGLLGFCIPIVGFILWLVWKDEKPNKAHSVCTGAWVSVVISVVLNLLAMVIGIAA